MGSFAGDSANPRDGLEVMVGRKTTRSRRKWRTGPSVSILVTTQIRKTPLKTEVLQAENSRTLEMFCKERY
jgi:hypothetical protein